MKKLLSMMLAFILLFSFMTIGTYAANTATPTSASVLVDSQTVSFEAYNVDGSNYFKLRDLAKVLSGTEKQFEVGWDGTNNAIGLTSGKAYTPVGGELVSSRQASAQSAVMSSAAVYLDGTKVSLTAYNIKNNNYFKLRDVANAINFGVGWDENTSTITIDTSVGYSSGSSCLTVHFLNVGQGDSEFIELPDGKTMLIDAGESEYADAIVSYIKGLGYKKIDYLVATHPHADHIGGMVKVVQSFSIGSVYMPYAATTTQTYSSLLTAIKSAGLTITTAKSGVNIFNSDGLTADIIAPVGTNYDDLNNYSAVIKLSYKNNCFLFMGDAEELSEKEITTSVKADVLKVGHHGSDSSTGQTFLNKVAPKYAVISVGAGNDYGHPAQTTLDKLSGIRATIYRTDKNGTVIIKSNGTDITVSADNNTSPSPSPTTKPTPTPTPSPNKPVTITPQPATPIGVTVYITQTGSKYHMYGCRYLSKSKIAISLSNAKAQGYGPCSVCNPPS